MHQYDMDAPNEKRPLPPGKVNWKYIVIFYSIAFILSAPANSFYFLEQWDTLTEGTVFYKIPFLPAGLGTLIAALIAFRVDKDVVRTITLQGNDRNKNIVIALTPVVVMTIAGIPNELNLNENLYALLISVVLFAYAFTEEIFWRGYMINALAPLGWMKNYLGLGILWWAWHFNFTAYGCTTFLVLVVISSFLIGKFTEGTRSYLAAAGLHSLIVVLTVGENSTPLLCAGGIVILIWILTGTFWKSKPGKAPAGQ